MLGWEIFVYRRAAAESQDKREGVLVARWMTEAFGGLDWADNLVASKQALDLGGSGYPSRYSIPAGVLLTLLSHGFPSARPGWTSNLLMDRAALASCSSEEELEVEAWDQS
jgi:hypothetical protein